MNTTDLDEFHKQRNEKQLRNIKYALNNIDQDKYSSSKRNFADQIKCVEEMTKTHEFIQSMHHVFGLNHPLIILYTPQQMTDIKRFCCRENDTVLGIDKTYNLVDFHVTPTVYKDLSVLRRATGENPICFGPTFIHQSSTTASYSTFLNSIANNLNDHEISN